MYAVVLTVAFLGFAADRVYLAGHASGRWHGANSARAPSADGMPSAARIARARCSGRSRACSRSSLLLAAWEMLARSGTFTPFQLPALSAVLERIWSDAVSGDLCDQHRR